jgi:NAD(P)-dependent dehydrogenase (short-subunit alcohol dehydrogenase family)
VQSLNGARAVVTGGGSPLGRDVCVALAGAGARVAVLDPHLGQAVETAAAVGGFGWKCDPADEGAREEVLAMAAEQLGGIDVIVDVAPQR